MANKPNNPSLWSKAKSMAKQKFDVYPSAYANGWAAKWYKGHGGTWRKAEYGMELPQMQGDIGSSTVPPMPAFAAPKRPLPLGMNFALNQNDQYALKYNINASGADQDGKFRITDPRQVLSLQLLEGLLGQGRNVDINAAKSMGRFNVGLRGSTPLFGGKFSLAGNYKTSTSPAQSMMDETGANMMRTPEKKSNYGVNASWQGKPFGKSGPNTKIGFTIGSPSDMGDQQFENGGTNNAGFRALPPKVQQMILDHMANGGEKMPPEIARARFAAAGNLDQMDDYGYAFGGYIPQMGYGGDMGAIDRLQKREERLVAKGYKAVDEGREKKADRILARAARVEDRKIRLMDDMTYGSYMPEMAYGGAAQQAAIAIAMKKAGKKPKSMKEGGDPDGEMAMGQIMAMHEKLSALQKFIQPDSDLEPWVASKLTLADDYLNSVADYMQYNPEENQEMQQMANGGYTVTRSHDRKGKTHKVTGPDGTVKYFGDSKLGQHPKDPERKAAFYARHKKNLDRNPYFRAFARATWADGGETDLPMYQAAGWVQRAADANLNFWEKCRLAGSADNGGGAIIGGGGRDRSPQYKDPFASLADIDNDILFDKESIKAVKKSRPSGVDKDMWNAIGAEARRLNNAYTNKYFWGNNVDPATGRLNNAYLADEWKSKVNIPEYYRYYNNTPIKDKKSVSAQDIYDYYQSQPGGLETFRSLINNNYTPIKMQGGYIPSYTIGGMPCYECGGMYESGGPVAGDEMDVTPEEMELLRQQGYQFEII